MSTLAGLIKSIDLPTVVGPRLELGKTFAQIDIDKLIGPRIAQSFAGIDIDKLIGPRIAQSFAGIDVGKLVGPGLDTARLTTLFDDHVVASVMQRIHVDSLSDAAIAASTLASRDIESLIRSSQQRHQETDAGLDFPQRLLDLGIQGLEGIPDEAVNDIENSLEQPDSKSDLRVPLAIIVPIVVGAFAFSAAIYNSLIAAESAEAESFLSSFFGHMNFYIGVALLILALRD